MFNKVAGLVVVVVAVLVGWAAIVGLVVGHVKPSLPPDPPMLTATKRMQVYLLDDLRHCQEASPVICSCRPAGLIPKSSVPKPAPRED